MSESKVFMSKDDDPEMQRAYENARATFRYFWREISWERRRIVPGLDLANLLRLDNGTAWVGFTAGTGNTYETHDILSWQFGATPIPTVVEPFPVTTTPTTPAPTSPMAPFILPPPTSTTPPFTFPPYQ